VSHRIPKYRKHASGQARVTLGGCTYYLGNYGTPESRRRYKELVNEWLTGTGRFAPAAVQPRPAAGAVTVNEVILAYLRHAHEYYGPGATEVEKVKLSVRPLRELCGRSPSAAFDALALEAVQEAMVSSGLARSTVNERVRVIKRMLKWAVRKKLVPAAVIGELQAVDGLKRGRTRARETEPVRPVPRDHVDAVLRAVGRHVAGLIRLQLLTGARPGELCVLRRSDIDESGDVWVYRPSRHKNLYRGHDRAIYFGPRAQAVLREFFCPGANAYLFSPREGREERFRALRANRRSPVQPSQVSRRKPAPKKLPGERYTTYSYRQAVQRACAKAGVPVWHPHQLRHSAGTDLRREFGVEVARIVLGHKTAFTTEIYAEADREKAVTAMAAVG
jgi:integrase